MKRRTKASQKRLNNLLILLLLVAVFLIMSTYAWFTANRTVNVDDITVNVETSSGLQISADAITWKTVLPYSDIKDAYKTYETSVNQLPKIMAPVSSALTNTDGKLDMFYGVVSTDLDDSSDTYGDYLLEAIKQTDKDTGRNSLGDAEAGYYLAFDLFLKDTVTVDNLYFGGTVWEYNVGSEGEDGKHTETARGEKKGLENAARVAMIKGSTNSNFDDSDASQALVTTGGKVVLWEPNADTHTQKAIDNGKSLGWLDGGATIANTNSPLAYDGTNQAFSGVELSKATSSEDTNSEYFTKIDSADSGSTGATIKQTGKADNVSIEIPEGLTAGVTKFRFYLWIEGQDIDCENNASGTNLEYNFKFSLDPLGA